MTVKKYVGMSVAAEDVVVAAGLLELDLYVHTKLYREDIYI